MPNREPLKPAELYHVCGADAFDFETTADVEPVAGVIGQTRAVRALDYAIAMPMDGHNAFVIGKRGTGRRSFVEAVLNKEAKDGPTPSDWCYVNNFDEPQKPTALELPAGVGPELCNDMDAFIEEVQSALSAAFESDDYHGRRQAIEQEFQEEHNSVLKTVNDHARHKGIRVIQSPTGVIFAPLRDGEVLGPDAFEKLSETEQKEIQEDIEEVGRMFQEAMESMPQRMRSTRQKIRGLDQEITRYAIGSLMNDLKSNYQAHPRVIEFLQAVEQDLVKHQELVRNQAKPTDVMGLMTEEATSRSDKQAAVQRRYSVNVIVASDPDGGAPVIIEDHPSHLHLIGRIEHRAQMGALYTDFNLIRAGALHRANGGFLVVEAHRVLTEPFAWQSLKQALKTHRIRIESIGEMYGMASTLTLEPDPIPLEVKVILIGEARLYYLLQELEPDFRDLFKVVADFDDRMGRDDNSQREFARVIAAIARDDELLPVERAAVCRLVEESSRSAGDREKLSTELGYTADLVRESHYWAKQAARDRIGVADVVAAIDSREERNGRIRDRVIEEIKRETILIDTSGERVGQINGLAVIQLGDFAFGRPNRITARIAMGTGKVVDIERESELGGPLHSKGVLILSGFIASNYAVDQPLSLAATIAFEQSYGGVDGDSASSAELYALLSAIAGVPINQSFAVTGSVNQYGEIQAIGGVNEKVEGFFDVCDARGLTGEQGVLIPASNLKHLMLRKRVVDAVAAGEFHIYAVEHVDEGLELLTGLDAGARDEAGNYPPGTLNRLICDGLRRFAEQRQSFGRGAQADTA